MKHLLTSDIEGADWGRIVANEADDTVTLKGFEFSFVSPYRLVNLGLTSGTLWADRNIGANSPEDSGLYFQWGDTVGYTAEQCGTGEGQKAFTWSDYKFGTKDNLTKYNDTDSKTILDLEDDAAHVIMGEDWRLPTKDEWNELWQLPKKFVFQTRGTTSDEWGVPIDYEDVDGVGVTEDNFKFVNETYNWIEETSTIKFCGIKFIGTNGNELYVPAVGGCGEGSLMGYGDEGYLWSSSLDGSGSYAWYGYFYYEGNSGVYNNYRFLGLPLRGVVGSQSLPEQVSQ